MKQTFVFEIIAFVMLLSRRSAKVFASGLEKSTGSKCRLQFKTNYTGVCWCTVLFDIRCSRLTSIPSFANVDGTVYNGIYMEGQFIKDLPQGAFGELRAKKITLNYNAIGDKLSSNAFEGLEQVVHELHLASCRIRSLPIGMLRNMEHLRHLHLWGNQIESLPANFFKDCKNLEELLLWGNRIKTMDEFTFSGLWKLRRLDLDKNNISVLRREAFRHMSNLEIINLGENNIQALQGNTFEFTYKLKVLNLDKNRIQHLYGKAFDGLRNLVSLSLRDNLINYVEADCMTGLRNLTTLNLQYNQMDAVWPKTLNSQKYLYRLNLANNRLTTLPNNLLRHCHRLRHVYLDNNQLRILHRCVLPRTRLPSQSLASPSTTTSNDQAGVESKPTKQRNPQTDLPAAGISAPFYTVSLLGNPLECGECRLLWLSDILREDDYDAAGADVDDFERSGSGAEGTEGGVRIWGRCANNATAARPVSVMDKQVLGGMRRSCNTKLIDCSQ